MATGSSSAGSRRGGSRVEVEQVHIEASVDGESGIVEGLLTVDGPHRYEDGTCVFVGGNELTERPFVVVRGAQPIARILRVDTLLVSAAGDAPFPIPGPLPAGAETARGRRKLLDELLSDRP